MTVDVFLFRAECHEWGDDDKCDNKSDIREIWELKKIPFWISVKRYTSQNKLLFFKSNKKILRNKIQNVFMNSLNLYNMRHNNIYDYSQTKTRSTLSLIVRIMIILLFTVSFLWCCQIMIFSPSVQAVLLSTVFFFFYRPTLRVFLAVRPERFNVRCWSHEN